jgi:hypothetical protein
VAGSEDNRIALAKADHVFADDVGERHIMADKFLDGRGDAAPAQDKV